MSEGVCVCVCVLVEARVVHQLVQLIVVRLDHNVLPRQQERKLLLERPVVGCSR